MEYHASKQHISNALKKGVRFDGRKPDEFRPMTIEVDGLKNAEGAAKVTIGDTVVYAGVKMAVGKPFPDRPASGVLMVNAELLPIAHPDFESGPPGLDAIELSRVIDRGIREGKIIDETALCIESGESVWMANVDICPLNVDGSLFDIGGIAAIVALCRTRFPTLENGEPNYKELSDKKLELSGIPIPITVFKIGSTFIVDPTYEEALVSDARLTITTLDDGTICSLQKGGNDVLSIDDIEQMFTLAIEKGKEIRDQVKAALK